MQDIIITCVCVCTVILINMDKLIMQLLLIIKWCQTINTNKQANKQTKEPEVTTEEHCIKSWLLYK